MFDFDIFWCIVHVKYVKVYLAPKSPPSAAILWKIAHFTGWVSASPKHFILLSIFWGSCQNRDGKREREGERVCVRERERNQDVKKAHYKLTKVQKYSAIIACNIRRFSEVNTDLNQIWVHPPPLHRHGPIHPDPDTLCLLITQPNPVPLLWATVLRSQPVEELLEVNSKWTTLI